MGVAALGIRKKAAWIGTVNIVAHTGIVKNKGCGKAAGTFAACRYQQVKIGLSVGIAGGGTAVYADQGRRIIAQRFCLFDHGPQDRFVRLIHGVVSHLRKVYFVKPAHAAYRHHFTIRRRRAQAKGLPQKTC